MKHLGTACAALAFVATTASGSAQIVNPPAESDVGPGAAQPPPQNNVFVNGALAVPGAPANTDTVPAKFSAKNAADDELITIAYALKTLTDGERRSPYTGGIHFTSF